MAEVQSGGGGQSKGLSLRWGGLMAWLVGLALLAGAVGGYPTWRWSGRAGLAAMAAAAAAALAAYAAALFIFSRRVRRGVQAAGLAFLATSPVRIVVTVGLATLAWWLASLQAMPLLIWSLIFYMLFLLAEVFWLTAALRPAR